jgi:hypothetical protein
MSRIDEIRRRVNDKYQGKTLFRNGKEWGICSHVDVVGPPSGFNKMYRFHMYNDKTSYLFSNLKGIRIFKPTSK